MTFFFVNLQKKNVWNTSKKMQHDTCRIAIDVLRRNGSGPSNVSADERMCTCTHAPTKCNWVGNPMQHACLPKEHTAPQNVYTHSHTGGIARIEVNKK